MLKLVGLHKDGSVADERVLIDAQDRPTPLLLALAALELSLDVALAFVLARTLFKRSQDS